METICDPCSEKNKRLVAEKYCSDCEEKLCTECAEWHLRCKVSLKQSLKVKQSHKTYDYPKDKLYSIQHHVDYRNNQSGRLCVFHRKQKKSLIIKQISDITEKLITEVESVQEKNEEKINTEKHEICQLASVLKDNKLVSMLTFLISSNSMSISLIADVMS
jgi:alpha-D-ribose 1-methylphosphonate 5-triphosphate diphosphatase PhnM